MFTHPETEERIFSEVETLMNVLRSIVNQNYQQALGYLENRKNILAAQYFKSENISQKIKSTPKRLSKEKLFNN